MTERHNREGCGNAESRPRADGRERDQRATRIGVRTGSGDMTLQLGKDGRLTGLSALQSAFPQQLQAACSSLTPQPVQLHARVEPGGQLRAFDLTVCSSKTKVGSYYYQVARAPQLVRHLALQAGSRVRLRPLTDGRVLAEAAEPAPNGCRLTQDNISGHLQVHVPLKLAKQLLPPDLVSRLGASFPLVPASGQHAGRERAQQAARRGGQQADGWEFLGKAVCRCVSLSAHQQPSWRVCNLGPWLRAQGAAPGDYLLLEVQGAAGEGAGGAGATISVRLHRSAASAGEGAHAGVQAGGAAPGPARHSKGGQGDVTGGRGVDPVVSSSEGHGCSGGESSSDDSGSEHGGSSSDADSSSSGGSSSGEGSDSDGASGSSGGDSDSNGDSSGESHDSKSVDRRRPGAAAQPHTAAAEAPLAPHARPPPSPSDQGPTSAHGRAQHPGHPQHGSQRGVTPSGAGAWRTAAPGGSPAACAAARPAAAHPADAVRQRGGDASGAPGGGRERGTAIPHSGPTPQPGAEASRGARRQGAGPAGGAGPCRREVVVISDTESEREGEDGGNGRASGLTSRPPLPPQQRPCPQSAGAPSPHGNATCTAAPQPSLQRHLGGGRAGGAAPAPGADAAGAPAHAVGPVAAAGRRADGGSGAYANSPPAAPAPAAACPATQPQQPAPPPPAAPPSVRPSLPPLDPRVADVCCMVGCMLQLMEQMRLGGGTARQTRRAMRQLVAADRDSSLRVAYLTLCAAVRAGDEEEVCEVFEDLRAEASAVGPAAAAAAGPGRAGRLPGPDAGNGGQGGGVGLGLGPGERQEGTGTVEQCPPAKRQRSVT